MVRRLFRELDETFFGYGSPVALGLFRIVFGLAALLNLALLATSFESWFGENGFVPAAAAERWTGGLWRLDLLSGVTQTWVTAVFFGLVVLSALLMTVGYQTRIASIAFAVGIVTLHHRNPFILHSGDTLMRVTAIYLALSPCGRACSLDRLIGLWKGTAPAVPDPVSLWPQRLIQVQLSVVYFFTVLAKWQGTFWRDGTATWYPPQLEEFTRFPAPAFLDRPPFLQIGTWGTLLIELALATLVWSPVFRKWVLIGGLVLHATIEYRFNIPMFAFIITSLYICHYEGHEVSAWAARLGERFRRWRINFAAPVGAAWREGPRLALEAATGIGLVRYVVGAEAQGGLWAALRRTPGAWPLWLFPPAWGALVRAAAEDAPSLNGGKKQSKPAKTKVAP